MKINNKYFICIFAVSLVFAQICQGKSARKRISDVSMHYSDACDIQAEVSFGRNLSARILGNYKLIEDKKITRYVNLVGRALSLYAGRPELKFRFGVIKSNEINAFAAPGGYVFITSGALKIMDSEAQLAAVLGHEIAHIVKKHVVKELEIRCRKASGIEGAAGFIGYATAGYREVFAKSLKQAEVILFKRGYKKADELEADRVGVLLASIAGYDPRAMKVFLIRARGFEPAAGRSENDHPLLKAREKELDKIISANMLGYVKGFNLKERFNEYISKGLL